MAKTTLNLEIEYDPQKTDPDGLVHAMDQLLETALSTPGILDHYGNPAVGQISVVEEPAAVTRPKIVLNIFGGVLQDVFASEPASILLVDWDTEGSSFTDNNIVELPDVGGSTKLASVAECFVQSLTRLAGTEAEAALKAAGMAKWYQPAAQPVDCRRSATRRWVLYSINTATLLTNRLYDSYDQAAEDANQADDILVLPLAFEEFHA
jgi:hypothetical protein